MPTLNGPFAKIARVAVATDRCSTRMGVRCCTVRFLISSSFLSLGSSGPDNACSTHTTHLYFLRFTDTSFFICVNSALVDRCRLRTSMYGLDSLIAD